MDERPRILNAVTVKLRLEMFAKLALVFLGISTLVSGSRQRSIFNNLPPAEIFPACLKTVSASLARRAPQAPISTEDVEPICENIITTAPNGPGSRTTAVLADCAELSGRIEEAAKNGYLNDGTEFCSNIINQNAKENDVPLSQYVPRGTLSKNKFCAHFSSAVLETCANSQGDSSQTQPETPAAELLHDAEAMDAPSMPHPVDATPAAKPEVPAVAEQHLAAPEAPITNMAAAPSTEDVHPSRMTAQYMRKNFGSILRFGGGAGGN